MVVASWAYNVTYHQVQGANSSIVAHSAITDSCYAGACSNQRVVVLRTTQSGSTPASVQGSLEYTAYSGAYSRTMLLWTYVKGTSITASNN